MASCSFKIIHPDLRHYRGILIWSSFFIGTELGRKESDCQLLKKKWYLGSGQKETKGNREVVRWAEKVRAITKRYSDMSQSLDITAKAWPSFELSRGRSKEFMKHSLGSVRVGLAEGGKYQQVPGSCLMEVGRWAEPTGWINQLMSLFIHCKWLSHSLSSKIRLTYTTAQWLSCKELILQKAL